MLTSLSGPQTFKRSISFICCSDVLFKFSFSFLIWPSSSTSWEFSFSFCSFCLCREIKPLLSKFCLLAVFPVSGRRAAFNRPLSWQIPAPPSRGRSLRFQFPPLDESALSALHPSLVCSVLAVPRANKPNAVNKRFTEFVFICYKLPFRRVTPVHQLNKVRFPIRPFHQIPVLWQPGGYRRGSSPDFAPPTSWNRTACSLHGPDRRCRRSRTGRTQFHPLAGSNLMEKGREDMCSWPR